jgi:VIT1/CCC1 family predicted Fe2+/Mn2+ transporter
MQRFFNNYLKEFVYGATDGTVTTFAIIAGSAGAELPATIVIILGVSNVLADGFSMASSNYLSEKSHRDQNDLVATIHPFKNAFATFISFLLVGSIPILPYVVNAIWGIWQKTVFVSCIFTFFAFLFIGQIRGRIGQKNILRATIETLVIGGVAATVAYSVGAFLDKII